MFGDFWGNWGTFGDFWGTLGDFWGLYRTFWFFGGLLLCHNMFMPLIGFVVFNKILWSRRTFEGLWGASSDCEGMWGTFCDLRGLWCTLRVPGG